MKKVYAMLLMICTLFAFSACKDDDNDSTPPPVPVSDVKMPVSAEIGGELTITGKGFTENSKILFRNESGTTEEATVKTITQVDIVVEVPATLEAGEYTVILRQGADEWELKKITLLLKSPITEVVLPKEIEARGLLKITGQGFAAEGGFKIWMEPETGDRIEMEGVEKTDTGIKFKIPEDFALGIYTVYVEQAGYWTLGMVKVITAGPRPVTGIYMKTIYVAKDGEFLTEVDDEGNPTSEIYVTGENEITYSYDQEERLIAISGDTYTSEIDYSTADKITINTASISQDDNAWFKTTTEFVLLEGVAQSCTAVRNYKSPQRVNGQRLWVDAKETTSYTYTHAEGFLIGCAGTIVNQIGTNPSDSEEKNYTWTVENGNISSVAYKDWSQSPVADNYEYTTSFANYTGGMDLWALLSMKFDYPDAELRLLGIGGKYLSQLPGNRVAPRVSEYGDLSEHHTLEYQKNDKGELTELRITCTDDDSAMWDENSKLYYQVNVYTLSYE